MIRSVFALCACVCLPAVAGTTATETSTDAAAQQAAVAALLRAEVEEARAASMWLGVDPAEPRPVVLLSSDSQDDDDGDLPGWRAVSSFDSSWRRSQAPVTRGVVRRERPGADTGLGFLYTEPRPVAVGHPESPLVRKPDTPNYITPLPQANVRGARPVPGATSSGPRATASIPNK